MGEKIIWILAWKAEESPRLPRNLLCVGTLSLSAAGAARGMRDGMRDQTFPTSLRGAQCGALPLGLAGP